MLKTISRVTVDEAFKFPTQAQFDRADLLIQYLNLPDLTDKQLAMSQAFVDRGGSVVSIHENAEVTGPTRRDRRACARRGNGSDLNPRQPRPDRLPNNQAEIE